MVVDELFNTLQRQSRTSIESGLQADAEHDIVFPTTLSLTCREHSGGVSSNYCGEACRLKWRRISQVMGRQCNFTPSDRTGSAGGFDWPGLAQPDAPIFRQAPVYYCTTPIQRSASFVPVAVPVPAPALSLWCCYFRAHTTLCFLLLDPIAAGCLPTPPALYVLALLSCA